MLMTNTEIYFLYEGLNKLRGLGINFPIRVGFNIVKNIKNLAKDYEAIEEARMDIIKKYEPLEEKDIDKVNVELIELGNISNNIDLIYIKLDDIADLEIPLDILEAIAPIILE